MDRRLQSFISKLSSANFHYSQLLQNPKSQYTCLNEIHSNQPEWPHWKSSTKSYLGNLHLPHKPRISKFDWGTDLRELFVNVFFRLSMPLQFYFAAPFLSKRVLFHKHNVCSTCLTFRKTNKEDKNSNITLAWLKPTNPSNPSLRVYPRQHFFSFKRDVVARLLFHVSVATKRLSIVIGP